LRAGQRKRPKLFSEIKTGEEEVSKSKTYGVSRACRNRCNPDCREDFLRFTNLSSEIADFSEGIAYYLVEIMEHNWVISPEVKKDLLKLSLAVLDSVLKLRETMMVLNYGPQKTLERAKDVEIAERIVMICTEH
jgi:uncharacterized protein Yka (UPF0111/DUF47 family)